MKSSVFLILVTIEIEFSMKINKYDHPFNSIKSKNNQLSDVLIGVKKNGFSLLTLCFI